MLPADSHTDIVNLLCRDSWSDGGSHSIENSCVHFPRTSDSLYLLCCFYQFSTWHTLASVLPIEYFLVHVCKLLAGLNGPTEFLLFLYHEFFVFGMIV